MRLSFGGFFFASLMFVVHNDVLSAAMVETMATNGSSYMKMEKEKFQGKSQRLITFNTDENSDINLELSFSTSFITIPVKQTMDVAKGALANVNLGAIFLSGIIFLLTTFAGPLISHLLSKKKQDDPQNRSDDYTEWADLFKTVDQVFAKNNLHPASCLQRIVCWLVRNASAKVARGSATSTEKIIDGITTSDWFNRIIDETLFETAVRSGLSNASCSKRFHKCKISQRNLETILKDLVSK